jgi:glycine cleavage system H protein
VHFEEDFIMIPNDYYYTEEHEWVSLNGDVATVGITSHATEELGEIVYVDLSSIGSDLKQMSEFGTVESVKTLSSLYSPVSGTILEINKSLADNPATINDSPFKEGWLIKVKVADPDELNELMSSEDYNTYLETN